MSSSRGSEVSFEKDELQNGVFTAEIVAALRAPSPADENRDGTVSVEELRRYVGKAVAARTGDMQHPTVDRDNRAVTIELEPTR